MLEKMMDIVQAVGCFFLVKKMVARIFKIGVSRLGLKENH